MADIYVHLREAHPKQQVFIGSPAKRKVIRAGRRSGKTTGVAILALETFMDRGRVLYATPTQEQIDRFWAECKMALAELTDTNLLYKNETRHIIEFPGTETRIRAKTAWDANSLRGDYADLLILDEFQLMHEDTWDRVGAPMLLDNNGNAVFIYTPPSLHAKARTKADDPQHAAKMFKRAEKDTSGRWAAFHFTSHENPHISAEALAEITFDMTQLAIEQEIYALDKDEAPGALWTRALLERTRVTSIATPLVRVGVGVDPPGGVVECGIVVAALGRDGHGYVVEDRSLQGSPQEWASEVVSSYNVHDADRVLAETNFGGDMVESTIRTVEGGARVSYKAVHASRGKAIRAEPVAALYERGMIHHVGSFPHLEDEMCMWMPGSSRSPNRLDAAVWVLTELMLGPSASMRDLPQDEETKSKWSIDGKADGPKWRL
jgi:hypothetical protein